MCTKCESSSYYLANGKLNKTPPPNFYNLLTNKFFTGSCKLCSSTMTNCSECSTDGSQCTKCSAGLFLFNSNKQCVSCDQSTVYKITFDATGLGLCGLCSDSMPNCTTCSNSSTCNSCASNFFLFDSDNNKTFDKCLDCNASTYYKTGSNDGLGVCNVCAKSIANCQECSSDAKTCKKCSSNYALQLTNGVSSSCVEASYCNSVLMYVSTAEPRRCVICSETIQGCSMCTEKNGKTHCIQCSKDKFLYDSDNDGVNEACATCLGKGLYQEGTTDGNGHCGLCNQKFSGCSECLLDGRSCTACQGNLVLRSSSEDPLYLDSCIEVSSCPSLSHYLSLDIPRKCLSCSNSIANCMNCSNDPNHCLTCANDYYLLDSSSSGKYDRCTSCTAPEYFRSGDNSGNGSCIRCESRFPNCRVCSDSGDRCLQCFGQYFLFDSDGDTKYDQCVVCNSAETVKEHGISTDITGKGICKRCSAMFPGCSTCNFELGCTKCVISNQIPIQSTSSKKYESCTTECISDNLYMEKGNSKKI
jgi:proprotein convertase subtilisin/kexin type 5